VQFFFDQETDDYEPDDPKGKRYEDEDPERLAPEAVLLRAAAERALSAEADKVLSREFTLAKSTNMYQVRAMVTYGTSPEERQIRFLAVDRVVLFGAHAVPEPFHVYLTERSSLHGSVRFKRYQTSVNEFHFDGHFTPNYRPPVDEQVSQFDEIADWGLDESALKIAVESALKDLILLRAVYPYRDRERVKMLWADA